jgi:multiple sugar transport system permease protein
MHLPRLQQAALAVFLVLALWHTPPAVAGEFVENPDYTGPKTTIRYAMWGGAGEVEMGRQICNAFVALHPDIRIEVSVYPWGQYWAKLQTQAASGLAPDVISLLSGQVGIWINHGALRPLDDFIRRDGLDLNAYHRAPLDNYTWDGQLFGFPMEIAVAAVIYSIDRLEENGIPRDQWPSADRAMDWESFKKLAQRLTLKNPDGTIAQYGMSTGGWNWNRVMFRLFGGEFFDRQVDPTRPTVADNGPLRDGMVEIFRTIYGERFHASDEIIANAGFANSSLLLSPRFAMSFVGPWSLRPLQEAGLRFGLAPPPHGPNPSQLISSNGVGIYADSEHPEEAWKLIRYMASEAVQPIFGKRLKGVPVLKSASQALVDNDYGIPDCEAFIADLPVSQPFVSSGNTYVSTAVDKWVDQVERVFDNEYDQRLRDLPKRDGRVSPEAYAGFVADMDQFVADTVDDRLPDLDQRLDDAFERAAKTAPGPFVGKVFPVLILVGLLAAFATYVVWVRRNRESEVQASRPANWGAYLCLSPWLIGFVFFTAGPILASIVLSFTEWNMIKPPVWIGAQHYVDLFQDTYFILGLKKTFSYAAFAIPISLFGGLFTAGLLTAKIRGADAFKAIFYFPSLFTGAAAAILWVNMFNKEFGVINRLLGFIGFVPVNWLDEGHAFTTVILMNLFWIGGAMIIYYAGMKQIPASLYEAAEIDGAGPVRRFFSITIPMLSPVILFMVVMTTIGSFQVFTPALFFATDSTQIGSPGDALRFYSVNIYDEAFNNLHMGKACSWAVVLFIIIFFITMLQISLSKRFVHSEGKA